MNNMPHPGALIDTSYTNNIRSINPPHQLNPDTPVIPAIAYPILPGAGTDTTHPDDKYWSEGFGFIGSIDPGNHLWTATEYNGRLIIGGHFNTAGSIFSRNIVAFDGKRWSAIKNGLFGDAHALLNHDGKLYVGGEFRTIEQNEDTVNYIAVWDGRKWSNMSKGFNRAVYQLTLFNGNIIAGGDFTSASGVPCNGLAEWDGERWQSLGGGVKWKKGFEKAFIEYDNKLIVGGLFDSAGGFAASNLACWDGSSWSEFGGGANGEVTCLAVFEKNLYAFGRFSIIGGISANRVAMWNGSNWKSLGTGINNAVGDAVIHEGKLIIVGNFTEVDGDSIKSIAVWDGLNWTSYDAGLDAHRYNIINGIGSAMNKLFIVGRYLSPVESPEFDFNVSVWDDTIWSPVLENSLSDWVFDFEIYDKYLFACGYFEQAGDVASDRVASWDGEKWHFMSPNNQWWAPDVATAMGLYKDELIVGGWFDTLGGIPAKNIAKWDGTYWSAIGDGFNVIPIEIMEYDGDLLVGGPAVGDRSAYVLKWDGSNWTTLAKTSGGSLESVRDLIIYDNKLIVAGRFDSINGLPFRGIAQWDGNNWSSLGGWIPGHTFTAVSALEIYNGNLIAAGSFDSIGGVAANRIAAWDGSRWIALDSSESDGPGEIWTTTIHHGQLIIGGSFEYVAGKRANNIAAYDGHFWTTFGTGINTPEAFQYPGYRPFVMALASYKDKLYVGGDFNGAGDKISQNIAVWTKKTRPELPLSDAETEKPNEFTLKQNYPNPFNPSTTIEYELNKTEHVVLEIYNILGQRITTLVNETQSAGKHVIQWDGRSTNGAAAASGIYFYKLIADDYVQTKKMLLLK